MRQFGRIMAGALVLIGLWAYYRGHQTAAPVFAAAVLAFAGASLAAPIVLKPLYVAWTYLGRLLGWVNFHLLLGLLFYTLFTLIGLAMRVVGHDPLYRRRCPGATSYFVRRDPTLLPPRHSERQF